MYLSDRDILKALGTKEIMIKDFDETRLQPASYDILLDNRFIVHNTDQVTAIDPANKKFPETKEIIISPGGHFVLHPGVSVLGRSIDFFGSDHYLIHLSGKSSLARIGLIIHNTAGIVNPGHHLNITFELCNLNRLPIILRPGMAIGQILFSKLSSPTIRNYKKIGRYHGKEWNSYIPPKGSKSKKLGGKKKRN